MARTVRHGDGPCGGCDDVVRGRGQQVEARVQQHEQVQGGAAERLGAVQARDEGQHGLHGTGGHAALQLRLVQHVAQACGHGTQTKKKVSTSQGDATSLRQSCATSAIHCFQVLRHSVRVLSSLSRTFECPGRGLPAAGCAVLDDIEERLPRCRRQRHQSHGVARHQTPHACHIEDFTQTG